jgi:hypothetical protein
VTVQKGQASVDGGAPVAASIEPGAAAVTIVPEGGDPVVLPYVDVVDLFDDNYTLRLTDFGGRRIDLSMLGKAYGQVVAEIRDRRHDALQKDLLLTGVRLQDTYPGKLFGGPEPAAVEIRLFEDSMVVVPERAQMFGIPYSFIESVQWSEDLYQTTVRTDDLGAYTFGHMAKRSEEFRDELNRLMAALATRTAETLQGLLGGVDGATVTRLAAVMRDGRAVQQRAVDAIDPALWPLLEAAVVGTDTLRESYDHLKSMSPAGWMALGVKTVRPAGDEQEAGSIGVPEALRSPGLGGDWPGGAAPEADQPDAPRTDPGKHHLWFFAPLTLEGNAIAHEITSEEGHATYLYRAVASGELTAEAVAASMARINRAILALNFRREPIYASDEEIQTGRFARYRVALRSLEHLRFAREQFLGRAIHNAAWAGQVGEALAKA